VGGGQGPRQARDEAQDALEGRALEVLFSATEGQPLPDAIALAPGLQGVVYGVVLIAFVLFEPLGLYGRWLKLRTWFQLFPFYRRGMFRRQKAFQKSERLR